VISILSSFVAIERASAYDRRIASKPSKVLAVVRNVRREIVKYPAMYTSLDLFHRGFLACSPRLSSSVSEWFESRLADQLDRHFDGAVDVEGLPRRTRPSRRTMMPGLGIRLAVVSVVDRDIGAGDQ